MGQMERGRMQRALQVGFVSGLLGAGFIGFEIIAEFYHAAFDSIVLYQR